LRLAGGSGGIFAQAQRFVLAEEGGT